MKILKQEAVFEEVKIGDTVELLVDYLLIRKGSLGKVVRFTTSDYFNEDRIKVEFHMSEVGRHGNSKIDTEDRFIFAESSELKLLDKAGE